MASAVIPEALEEPLLRRAGEINTASGRRWTSRELAAWLKIEHGIDCAHTTVQRCLNGLRRARSNALKEILRDELLGSLVDDWQRLDEVALDVYERMSNLPADAKPDAFLAYAGELRKLAATKIHAVARVDEDEDREDLKGAAKGLADFLSRAFPDRSSAGAADPLDP